MRWRAQFVLAAGSAHGYELATHRKLTHLAYDRSVLADPLKSPLLDLGIADPATQLSPSAVPGTEEAPLLNAKESVATGAMLEDKPLLAGRFLRHFFDPQQSGRGLLNLNMPSPDWILEDEDTAFFQDYSLRDALAVHMKALTLPTKAQREEQLVTLLEIIGRGVHHLQDMSQPAHTRDDGHQPGDGDIYEKHTEEWFVGHPIPDTLVYGGPAVSLTAFDTGRKFWTNGGAGIAEFTSRNFVSKDTNFVAGSGGFQHDPQHPKPVAAGSSVVPLTALGYQWTLNPFAMVQFVHTQVDDVYSGASFVNDRASTYSIFTADLQQAGFQPMMALNEFNFARNYDILMPRAIAYSAGLINYYFRGRLVLDEMTAQGGTIEMTVKNVSDPAFVLREKADTSEAEFKLYYDARDGERREIEQLTGGELSGGSVGIDETVDLSFSEPSDVDRTKEKPYLLVFNGTVGTEPGIAAMAFGTAGTGFVVAPYYLTDDGITDSRTIRWNDGGWNLTEDTGLQAGNIDWKGVSPQDVLTWDGASRYLNPGGSNNIYMNGRVLAHAPDSGRGVIGASIRYMNGVRTLNVVTISHDYIAVYSRTLAEKYENDDLWTDENPLGWRPLYSGRHGQALTSFLFNASGTEGQYITRHEGEFGGPERRVKITLSGDSAAVADFPAVATVARSEVYSGSDTTEPEITAGICVLTPGIPNGDHQPAPGDACLRTELSGARTVDNTLTVTDMYSDKTLYCVDYKGNQEVFCELMPPAPVIQSNTSHSVLTRDNLTTASAECGAWRRDADMNFQSSEVFNSQRTMRIGTTEIPWTGIHNSDSWETHYTADFLSPMQYSGGGSSSAMANYRTTRLVYADARYDLAVYEITTQTETSQSAGSWNEHDAYPPGGPSHNTSSVRVIMSSPGHSETLFEHEEVEELEASHPVPMGDLPTGQIGFDCAQKPVNSGFSNQSTMRDAGANDDAWSYMMGFGSYAVDREGRIGASQRIMFISPVLEDHGFWHHLAQGNLPALLPGTPPQKGYGYDIRLIR